MSASHDTPRRRPPDRSRRWAASLAALAGAACLAGADDRPAPPTWAVEGLQVTPHVRAPGMRYRREPEPESGALIRVFVRNPSPTEAIVSVPGDFRVDGSTPAGWLERKAWWWHDTPAAWGPDESRLPAGALSVWTFNQASWTPGQDLVLEVAAGAGSSRLPIRLDAPQLWLASVAFLGPDGAIAPDRMVVHVVNRTPREVRIEGCRLWLPASGREPRALHPGAWMTNGAAFPASGRIPAGDQGGAMFRTGVLPLGYAAVEARVKPDEGAAVSVWGHLRVRCERFDISGGWVADVVGGRQALAFEPFLKTLRRLHVNTGHMAVTPGYTDTDLYARYPLKYFNALQPIAEYDRDDVLPRIHAVEFLGEPQDGGGKPVPPMEVFARLRPYATSRLATTLTHSEERIWAAYAGLSDYPHYDAYRVSAPSPDVWRKYDRWEGRRIGWGAPLETIGEMCRSLRELYRPVPTAYWSQGPHRGWDMYDGRRRTSPTPDELRLQAYHALSSRITSLYWFNLSLRSLVKFRDTLDELTRVGREMRMLDELYLEGAAYDWEQVRRDGKLDWELASIAGPRGAVLFALDLDYRPDPEEKVFRFGPPRAARFHFKLPPWLSRPAEVFRVDADGVYDVEHRVDGGTLEIEATSSRVAIFVVAADPGLRAHLEAKRQALVAEEQALGFDPARSDADFEVLKTFAAGPP